MMEGERGEPLLLWLRLNSRGITSMPSHTTIICMQSYKFDDVEAALALSDVLMML
jgi:hypothetical protein